jgi:serine/threonine-protein kinase RsbW
MPADLDLSVPATTRGLRAALQSLDEACVARNVEADLVSRARIVIEELFTNTIKYGYGGECDRPVRLSLSVDRTITVTFEDEALPFDPTAWTVAKDIYETPSDRPVGQAGIALILGLSSSVSYLPLPNGNRITITIEQREPR